MSWNITDAKNSNEHTASQTRIVHGRRRHQSDNTLLTFLIKLEASHLSTMIFRSFLDPFRFKSFHRKKSSSANGLQLSVFLKYIYYYQKSNWKKGGPTNFFIFPPRERALSPAGLMGDSMMLLHAWHKGQCGSTDQVAWLNPRFFRVFWFDGSIFFRDAMNIQELLLP